ncbi:MAG TPA: LLM class flavin-dependent oxidoreductase [Segeticoccus sp.]|uniref:LLM class flavin-dependent oxidoreductase n=1 Tax=Segeticoccus sp. TaxID=2706531 RepID=UPI002D7E6BE1|nr:LLM class flavin-dependent oxidoreductase [Segeticoccus sp.]HET8601228.1 LLM class flavin-dependent oxidoreductase [Segeticoccus sp.]
MRYGFVVPYASEPEFVEVAGLAEQHGWDAVFSWEAVWRHDAWATLAAAAVRTERIRLGTLLTPVPRYRPWDLASRVGSVDRLSGGRVVLGAGLGATNENWLAFEPDEGRRVRARRLDEALDVYAGLMAGQPFSYSGTYYSARPVDELNPPPPVQRPHPPVWVVGALVPGRERQPSLERAARWDGIFPAVAGGAEGSSGLSLDTFPEIVERLRRLREEQGLPWEGYDVAVEGDTFGDFGDVHGSPEPWADAGATWWVESWWDLPEGPDGVAELRRRVAAGPPAG